MGLGLAPAPSQRGQCHKITRGAIPDGKGLCRAAPRHKPPQKRAVPSPPASPGSIIRHPEGKGAEGRAEDLIPELPAGRGWRVWITCLISGCVTSLSHISHTLAEVIGKPLEWPRDL